MPICHALAPLPSSTARVRTASAHVTAVVVGACFYDAASRPSHAMVACTGEVLGGALTRQLTLITSYHATAGCTTVGHGGHAEALLEANNSARVLCIDADAVALATARSRLARFGPRAIFSHSCFSNVSSVARAHGGCFRCVRGACAVSLRRRSRCEGVPLVYACGNSAATDAV